MFFFLVKKLVKWLFIGYLLLLIAFHITIVMLLVHWENQPVYSSMFMIRHRFITGEKIQQQWVDYSQIAEYAKQATIASEDAHFIKHSGFDVVGIRTAITKNREIGKVVAGGSTISQQLAKNLFLTHHRSYLRKGEEAIITIILERLWDKKRILEVYLNVAEFGSGIYGIESATQYYFGKSASQLNQDEAALLISMLNRPKYYQLNLDSNHLDKKHKIIMERMSMANCPK